MIHKIFNFFIVMILSMFNICAFEENPDYYAIHGSMSLYAIKKGSGYKLYNKSMGKMISKQVYDRIYGCYTYSGCDNQVVVVRSEGRFGLVDIVNGKEILRPAGSPVTDFADGVYTPEPMVWMINNKKETLTSMPVYTEARWGYHNDLNPVIYYYTWDMETSLLGTLRIGFCDKDGKEVIPPLYESGGSFIDGLAVMVKGNKHGVINDKAEQIIPFEYDMIEYPYLKDFFRVVRNTGSYESLNGVADRSGRLVIPCEYNKIEIFYHTVPGHNGYVEMFRVCKKAGDGTRLYGLKETNGKDIFPVKYAYIDDDGYGRYILYATEKRAGMADNDKRIMIPMVYDRLYSTEDPEYIIVEQDGKPGLVTCHNQVLIKPGKFQSIRLLRRHGRIFFFAMVNEKWGHIDRTGKILLAPEYDEIEPYYEKDDGSMVVLQNGQWMRIDSHGRTIERYTENPYNGPELLFPPIEQPY